MDLQEIPSVLACDVGNTAIHFAHVRGDQVTAAQSVGVEEPGKLGPMLRQLWQEVPPPRKLVAASVNPAALKALEGVVG